MNTPFFDFLFLTSECFSLLNLRNVEDSSQTINRTKQSED